MSKDEMINIKWDLLGAKLAVLSDEEQSEFFKGFALELASSSYESHYRREMQMMMVNDKLPDKVKKILEDYLPALWFKEKN